MTVWWNDDENNNKEGEEEVAVGSTIRDEVNNGNTKVSTDTSSTREVSDEGRNPEDEGFGDQQSGDGMGMGEIRGAGAHIPRMVYDLYDSKTQGSII